MSQYLGILNISRQGIKSMLPLLLKYFDHDLTMSLS